MSNSKFDIVAFSFPLGKNSISLSSHRIKFAQLLLQDSPSDHHHFDRSSDSEEDLCSSSCSFSSSSTSTSCLPSYLLNPSSPPPYWRCNINDSPIITKSTCLLNISKNHKQKIQLVGSLVRDDGGHVYSLVISSRYLYTGSNTKNIHFWSTKSGNFTDSCELIKSSSGFVKSIVVGPNGKIFTGHQDGKIRVWLEENNHHPVVSSSSHKRVGSLPKSLTWRDSLIKRKINTHVKKRHTDAVSCLGLDKEAGLLYSASWDKTVKLWRLHDSACVDSFKAHDDAVNAVIAAGFAGLVFSGSADGTIKVWRRENKGKTIRHSYVEKLTEQTCAVTSLAVMTGPTRTLYAGSSDGLVSFWEWNKLTGNMSYGGVLRGHKQAVLCVVTAGDRLVLSGSADGTICVWRIREVGGDHVCVSVLTGHTSPVKCLAVDEEFDEEDCRDGDDRITVGRRWRVYSGSLDNSVKIWMVED